MVVRSSHLIALAVALTGFVGCTGGVAGNTGLATFGCDDPNTRVICLQSCSLGCSASGCARTDIAQNETIILQFSDAIDPLSVNSSTIRLRTASGEQPVGQFFVNGNQVEFLPTLAVTSGQTFFGFQPEETYTMTIPGGDGQLATVRSTSGKTFARTLTCTLRSSLGIVDTNGVPPAATMVLPSASQLIGAPRTTDIVLEFNELIDATPFLGGSQSPVLFNVRRTRDNGLGGFECDSLSQAQVLTGTQRLDFDPARAISVLTFNPAQELPSNVCIEVSVTSGVADLAGQRAAPQTFQFLTEVVPLVEDDVTEEFDTTIFFDAAASAGSWGGGQLTFARIGGDARHGEFNLAYCINTGSTVGGKSLYRVNCDLTTIPATFTTTGSPIAVTDGRFQFSRMQVPADVRLEFFGNNPPQITVAGTLEILGDINIAGASIANYQTTSPLNNIPQAGGLGGVFGGNGGNGASRNTTGGVTGVPPVGLFYNGRDGGNARVLGGHAYAATVANTGGKGSTMTPANGLHVSVFFPNGITVPGSSGPACSASAGGGGGSSVLRNPPTPLPPGWTNPGAGAAGRVVTSSYGNPPVPTLAGGPDAPGGAGVQLFPFPAGTGFTRSSSHFLVGGGGGGGAATQPALALSLQLLNSTGWSAGCAGGGGGGAISLRAGSLLRLGSAGKILANGGSAPNDVTALALAQPVVAPGGGGAGGSVVLQSGGTYQLLGQIDVRGGNGGTSDRTNTNTPSSTKLTILNQGGKGGDGFVRLEAPTAPPLSALATMQPAAADDNVAALTETRFPGQRGVALLLHGPRARSGLPALRDPRDRRLACRSCSATIPRSARPPRLEPPCRPCSRRCASTSAPTRPRDASVAHRRAQRSATRSASPPTP
jgi:hypothetical protein